MPPAAHSQASIRALAPVALCLLGLVFTGCSSTASTSDANSTYDPSPSEGRRSPQRASSSLSAAEAETRLRAAARRWENTPHEMGGTSKRGVDCSALVQSVYANEFGVSVPRTTEQQVQVGQAVSQSNLQPGDLVFFRPGGKGRHVGIYISDGEFLHASSNSGVRISPLDRSYWQKYWWQGRRILSVGPTASATPSRSPAEPSPAEPPSDPSPSPESEATAW